LFSANSILFTVLRATWDAGALSSRTLGRAGTFEDRKQWSLPEIVVYETGVVKADDRAHVVELGVIPRVEALGAKLKMSSTVIEVEVLK